MKSDKKEIVSSLLADLRGRHSPAKFGRRLSLRANQYHRWESGHTILRWKDLIALGHDLKIPLERKFDIQIAYQGDPADFKSLAQHLLPTFSQAKIAQLCGVSVKAISKWVRKEASPPVEAVLKMVEKSSFSLSSFLMIFMSSEKMNLHTERHLKQEKESREEILNTPWAMGLLCLFDTGILDQIPREQLAIKLSERLGLEIAKLLPVLEKLFEKNILMAQGHSWLVDIGGHIDISGNETSLRQSIDFWTSFGLRASNGARADKKKPGRAGYLAFTASLEDLPEIHQAFLGIYQKLHEISNRQGQVKNAYVFSSLLSEIDSPLLGSAYEDYLGRWALGK